jgi:Smg protein
MKENMFDVLMYLFENPAEASNWANRPISSIVNELTSAGFDKFDIHNALDWLEGLGEVQERTPWANTAMKATRIYTADESERLTPEAQGFLHFLEQVEILNSFTREIVIDRALALDTNEIHLSQIKWLVLIVLFSYPGREAQLAKMEEYILDINKNNGLH